MFKPSAKFFKKTTSDIGKTLQKVPSEGIKTDKFLQSYSRNCKYTKRRKKN